VQTGAAPTPGTTQTSAPPERGPRSSWRIFVGPAAISLVPVLILGLVLAQSYRNEARSRGLAEGRSEAALISQTAIEPQLGPTPLSRQLPALAQTVLANIVAGPMEAGRVLRLRLHDLSGQVVFSDDGSGFGDKPEDEALQAAAGATVARLTRLNTDTNDTGRAGVRAVEVYLPLSGGARHTRVGVLEIYLPYAPIDSDVSAGLHRLYLDLGIGLGLLYIALFLISASASRGLRREIRLTTYLAGHDTLTGLPNRTAFRRSVAEAQRRAERTSRPTTVATIDLDRFNEVNDTLGHQNGDRLLVALAGRIRGRIGRHGSAARLGGDEFGVILVDDPDPETTLWDLRREINGPVEVDGLWLSLDSSIGFVKAPADGGDTDELLQRAGVAAYVAKVRHLGVLRYEKSLDPYDTANLALASELRQAIPAGELFVTYQPKASIADDRVEAVEALIRWQHPSLGVVYPDRFVPLAEQTDLIDDLTRWVMVRALSEMRDLGEIGGAIAVAVNVSARNLSRDGFPEQVRSVLDETGVPPDRLIVELTETALMDDPDTASRALSALAHAGVRSSLDDFGQGHTSLRYLSRLPVHELKIDKAFVMDMLENPHDAAIVRAIIELGHTMDWQVVAEGVETAEILASLRQAGCDVAQGYLLARPMRIDGLADWLKGHRPPEGVLARR
jgi:diguanylate cyclase (GGDEF)-like protein